MITKICFVTPKKTEEKGKRTILMEGVLNWTFVRNQIYGANRFLLFSRGDRPAD